MALVFFLLFNIVKCGWGAGPLEGVGLPEGVGPPDGVGLPEGVGTLEGVGSLVQSAQDVGP